jgi:hypothetical protein
VPADHRLRLENFPCVQYSRSHTIESRKHQAVKVAEGQSLRGFALQHVELVSKDKDLGLAASDRNRDQGAPDQPAKIAHREASISRFAVAVSRFGFAVGTTTPERTFSNRGPILSNRPLMSNSKTQSYLQHRIKKLFELSTSV